MSLDIATILHTTLQACTCPHPPVTAPPRGAASARWQRQENTTKHNYFFASSKVIFKAFNLGIASKVESLGALNVPCNVPWLGCLVFRTLLGSGCCSVGTSWSSCATATTGSTRPQQQKMHNLGLSANF